jgi:hypothetical protein
VTLSDDIDADLVRLRTHFDARMAKHPERY